MRAPLFVILVLVLPVSGCAQQASERTPAKDACAMAQDQALALGLVLGEVQACDPDAWRPPFHEFMAAKRQRGLDGQQTAMIAVLVGTSQARGARTSPDCTDAGRAKRVAALDQLRADW